MKWQSNKRMGDRMGKDEKISSLADSIISRFRNAGVEVERNEIVKRLRLLIDEFKVPEGEAVRTITNWLMKEHEVSREQLVEKESALVKIGDISKAGEWVSLKARVVQLWDSTSPNVSQVGLVGDETGIIKFVIWAKAGKGEVEEGKSYLFKNVVTDSFGGRLQININRFSDIVEIEEEIELPPREVEVVGALVAIQQNSGLIQRCPECKRVMSKGICPVHGKVKGYDDLRIKGVLDDGTAIYEVILNQENIKELTGMGLDDAVKIAHETLDRNAVLSELKKKLLGRYLRVDGTRGERFLLVKHVEFVKESNAKELLEKVEKLEAGG